MKKLSNADVARMFEELANALAIKGENPFRIRAYERAVQTINNLSEPLWQMKEKGERKFTDLPGVGAGIAEKIEQILETGAIKQLNELEKEVPKEVSDLVHIRGLGPKRVKIVMDTLKIKNVDDLEKAAKSGKLDKLEGFGAKSSENILKGIELFKKSQARFRLGDVYDSVYELTERLKKVKGVKQVTPAGSFRRHRETVGDIDILVTGTDSDKVMEAFTTFGEVGEVLAKGETKSTVRLNLGILVDVRFLAPSSYGAALQYFTGSQQHNIVVRGMAREKGLKISEYGVFRDEKLVAGKTEEEVYKTIGLPLIPPELREDRGEITAARKDELPKLIELGDITGELHAHTTETDGKNSLDEMARAAQERGYEYLLITDHSKSEGQAGGMDEKRLRKQMKEIDALNQKLQNFTLLKGMEVDILNDGSLDLPMSVLKELDIVAASIHSGFNMPEKKMTKRIITALESNVVNIFCHPTGRLINKREPYAVNMDELMTAAKDNGVFLELNAHPYRLDLKDVHCRMAKEKGIKIVIATDAHSVNNLDLMEFGIFTARRGWLEKEDVLNTQPLQKLLTAMQRK